MGVNTSCRKLVFSGELGIVQKVVNKWKECSVRGLTILFIFAV